MINLSPLTIMSRMKNLHFVGIGGAGMGGIAEVLFHQGFNITGSDTGHNAMIQRLKNLGIVIYPEHHAGNLGKAQAVIRSTAIAGGNPEIHAARLRRLPVVPRAVMLGELMRFRYGIAVSGTHGKTTTTSLLATIFAEAGLDPTFVIGGLLNSAGVNARLGAGQYLIAEADESDASFLYLHPMMTIVTNIDADHMETYQNDFGLLKKSFMDFIHHLPFYGLAVLCHEDETVREILPEISRPMLTYGFSDKADVYAGNIRQIGAKNYFTVHRSGRPAVLEVVLNLAGEHNVLNSLAAIAAAAEAGIPDRIILTALENFAGAGRRMQIHGDYETPVGKVLLIDDYGHHPREVAATTKAIRKAFPGRRLVVAYQPHRYTRTRDLMQDFARALSEADVLLLLEVYSAGEALIAGADSQALSALIHSQGKIQPILVSPKENLTNILKDNLKNNDVLLMQGAGDIGALAAGLADHKLQF